MGPGDLQMSYYWAIPTMTFSANVLALQIKNLHPTNLHSQFPGCPNPRNEDCTLYFTFWYCSTPDFLSSLALVHTRWCDISSWMTLQNRNLFLLCTIQSAVEGLTPCSHSGTQTDQGPAILLWLRRLPWTSACRKRKEQSGKNLGSEQTLHSLYSVSQNSSTRPHLKQRRKSHNHI